MATHVASSETPTQTARFAPFPHHYEVRLDGRPPGGVLLAPPRPPILGGAPAEFGGSDQWWSPEHLLLASASLCLRATFEAMARLKHIAVQSYKATARADLDRTPAGPAFSWIRLVVDLRVAPGDEPQVRALIEKAKEHCIVANSLRVPVLLEAKVNGS